MPRIFSITAVKLFVVVQILTATGVANAQTKKVACVGDSITAPTNGWCYYLGMKLGSGYMAQTFGVSGTTLLKNVGQPAFSSSAQYQPSHDFAPNIVVIMLGTNDSTARNWDAGKDHFVKDYEELIDSYTSLASKPLVILNTAPPASNDNMFGISGMTIEKEVNPLIKQVATTKMCPVADVWAAFGGDVSKLNSFDGVHPGDSGQMAIGETVAKVIMMPVVAGGAAGMAASAAGSGGNTSAGAAGGGARAGASATASAASGAGGTSVAAAMGGNSASTGSAGSAPKAGTGAITSPSGSTSNSMIPRSPGAAAGVGAPASAAGNTGTAVNPVTASTGTTVPVNPEPASGCSCRTTGGASSKSGPTAAFLLLLAVAMRSRRRRRAPLTAAVRCNSALSGSRWVRFDA